MTAAPAVEDTTTEASPTIETDDAPAEAETVQNAQGNTLGDLVMDLAGLTKEVATRFHMPIGQAHGIVKTTLDYQIATRSLNIQQMSQMPPPYAFPPPPAEASDEADTTQE